MRANIPDWVLVEFLTWIDGAKSGDLSYEFNSGKPQRLRRHEVVTPPRDATTQPATRELGIPKLPPQHCPDDDAVMAEIDYGDKMRCSQCDKLWTVWQLRKMGKYTGH